MKFFMFVLQTQLVKSYVFEVVLWDPNHESFCNDVSLKEISKVVWTIKIATRLKSSWTTFKNYRSSKSVDKRFCIYYLTVQFMNACWQLTNRYRRKFKDFDFENSTKEMQKVFLNKWNWFLLWFVCILQERNHDLYFFCL